MDEKFNLAEIIESLKNNPSAQKELEEIKSLREKLRKLGIERREYQLAHPFGRRQIKIRKSEEPDFRTIKLTTSRR